ncbi:hypothetical protein BGZ72_001598, partial [Mortierella alpina]
MASKLPAQALAVAIPSTTPSAPIPAPAPGVLDTSISAPYSASMSGTPSASTPTSGMHSPPLSATVEDEAMEMNSATAATAPKAPSGTMKAELGHGTDQIPQHHIIHNGDSLVKQETAKQSFSSMTVQGSRENHAPQQPGLSSFVSDPFNSSEQAVNQRSLDLRQLGKPTSTLSRQVEFARQESKELAIQRVLEHGKVLK